MLKGKTKTYLLTGVVFAIWAIVGYQIYSTMNPTEANQEVVNRPLNVASERFKTKDTFSIKNNYRDPFLGELANKKTSKTKNPNQKVKKDTIIIPAIKYKGLVQASDSGKKIFAVSINGSEQLLNLGDDFKGVKILKGNSTELVISFQGRRKTILK